MQGNVLPRNWGNDTGHTSTETSSSSRATLVDGLLPQQKSVFSGCHSNTGPNFHIPGSAFVNESAKFVTDMTGGGILIFGKIQEPHIISETALIPPGDYQPQVQVKFTVPISREIRFRISPIRSSLDLLVWASTHQTSESLSLSELVLRPESVQIYPQQEWISIRLPAFVIKEPTRFLVEVISPNSLLSDSGIQMAFFSILTQSRPSPVKAARMSSPVKEDVSSSPTKDYDLSQSQNVVTRNVTESNSTVKARVFDCPHPGCDRSFSRIFNLRSHSKVHEVIRSREFVCSTCQMGFARSQDLSRHALTHSGEKNFICPGCAKKFSRKDALRRHIRATQCCPMEAIP